MSKLHLIAQALSASALEAAIERFVAADDQLLFIGDAVVCLLKHPQQMVLSRIDNSVFALIADLKSRGLTVQIPDSIHLCNDDKMVDLTITSSQVISW